MSKSRLLPLLLLVFFAVGGPSCSNKSAEPAYRIGFSQCGDADDWRKYMLQEMKRELAFHPNLQLLYKQADDNSQRQVDQVRELLAEGIDLLLISPNEIQPLTPIVEEVYKKGIPVIVIDREIATSSYTNFIGADNYEVGRIAGQRAASLLNGKGTILQVTGLPNSSPAIGRQKGFEDALRQWPEMKILQTWQGDWVKPLAPGTNSLAEVLSKTDLVYAHNDVMAMNVHEAARRAGLNHIRYIGVDALPVQGMGMDMVAEGTLSASMLYSTGGVEAIRNAVQLLRSQPLPKRTILPTLVVDSSNVRMMKLQSDKILSQQQDIEKQQDMIAEQRRVYNSQRTFVYILMVTLSMSVLFAGLLWYSSSLNKKINHQLARKNEEISLQSEQLLEMSARASAANEARIHFFTNISHEFRTPLTLILAPLEELLENRRLQPHLRQQLSLMRRNVMRLLRLVNQLIDLRRIEFHKMQVRAVETDLIGFANEVVQLFQEIARRKQIDCRFLTAERSLPVWIDESMLDKVLFNLLSNAFKFTGENGSITLRIQKDEIRQEAVIEVQDTGMGIPPQAQEHIFELFYQGDHDTHKGSGLGLALCKELVELHHGTITVKSHPGKGTLFTVRLPLGNLHFQPEELAADTQESDWLLDEQKYFTEELGAAHGTPMRHEAHEESATGSATGIAPDAAATADRPTILLIEDNPEMRSFLRKRLSTRYEVLEAADGNSGLQQAMDQLPDGIICDVMMPGRDGISLTSQLKSDLRTAHIPVILLTARTATGQQLEGLKSRADAYITKPFEPAVLEHTLGSLLANRSQLKEHFTGVLPADLRRPEAGLRAGQHAGQGADTPGSGTARVTRVADRKFVSSFTAIVEANIGNDQFSVEDICKEMGISKVQLYRKVKALLNTNINEYILQARIQKARYYLQHEEFNVTEVAYKTGFSSPAYFSTVFKKITGSSPTAFRDKG